MIVCVLTYIPICKLRMLLCLMPLMWAVPGCFKVPADLAESNRSYMYYFVESCKKGREEKKEFGIGGIDDSD